MPTPRASRRWPRIWWCKQINACIAAASGTDKEWGEPLTILRYQPGQQYRPHHDAGKGAERGLDGADLAQ